MRSIVIDELREDDLAKLAEHLNQVLKPTAMPDVFWLELPDDLLTPEQTSCSDCRPHRISVVLDEDSLRLELLVRSASSLRCKCTGYTSKAQRDFCLNFVDKLIEDLDLKT